MRRDARPLKLLKRKLVRGRFCFCGLRLGRLGLLRLGGHRDVLRVRGDLRPLRGCGDVRLVRELRDVLKPRKLRQIQRGDGKFVGIVGDVDRLAVKALGRVIGEGDADILSVLADIVDHGLLHVRVGLAVEHLQERIGLVVRVMADLKEPVSGVGGDNAAVLVENIDRLDVVFVAQLLQPRGKGYGPEPVALVVGHKVLVAVLVIVGMVTPRGLVEQGGVLLEQIGDQPGLGEEAAVIVFLDDVAVVQALLIAAAHLVERDDGAFDALGDLEQGLGIEGDAEDQQHAEDRQRKDLAEDGAVKDHRRALFAVEDALVGLDLVADKVVAHDDRIGQAQQHDQNKARVGPEEHVFVA